MKYSSLLEGAEEVLTHTPEAVPDLLSDNFRIRAEFRKRVEWWHGDVTLQHQQHPSAVSHLQSPQSSYSLVAFKLPCSLDLLGIWDIVLFC